MFNSLFEITKSLISFKRFRVFCKRDYITTHMKSFLTEKAAFRHLVYLELLQVRAKHDSFIEYQERKIIKTIGANSTFFIDFS